ncbi:hypothetical protein BBK36DRAFT_1131360, partial [Trichoderma citrinoviride]
WNVINTIWDENKLISVDVNREIAAHIGHWADDWLNKEENKEKLIRWEESHGPVFRILDDQDHESLGLIQDDVVPLIASALKSRRDFLLSGREAAQVEEPAELVTACCTNNIENWLTGQQVFDNNGLPAPPMSEPHRDSSSLNGPAPCIVENGKHYYLPQQSLPLPEPPTRPTEALQALQKSVTGAAIFRPAEAAKLGVVIVNGSNMPKQLQTPVEKADQKKVSEIKSQNDPRRTASMPETSSPVAGSDVKPRRNEALLCPGNRLAADAEIRRSSESACLANRGKSSPSHSSSAKNPGVETMRDKLTREVADSERIEQGFKGMSQPYDDRAIIYSGGDGQFPLHEAARLENWQSHGPDGPMHDPAAIKPLHSSQRYRRSTQDARYYAENLSNGFSRPRAGLPIKSSTEPTPFYMQPDKGFIPPHLVSANGFSHHREQLYSAANKQQPHPAPYRDFSGASQGAPHQQFANGTHSGVVSSVKLRNPPASSTDENSQHPHSARLESYHGSSTASSQNGYNNSRIHHKAGQRRGSQGQKTHGFNLGQQAQAEHHVMPHESSLNKPWRRSTQQDDVRQNTWCRNPVGLNGMDYIHCTCSGCAERNRSVWVSVTHDSRLQKMEIQAFLKFGLSSKFGQVEEVCQTTSLTRDAFIVSRFVTEASVSLALAFGGGLMPEKNIRLLIRPVFRSKWMKNLHYQQARPLPPVPVTHQQPAWVEKAPSSTNLGLGQTVAPGPSFAPSPTHSTEREQSATSSSPKSAEVLPQATASRECVNEDTTVPRIEPKSFSPRKDHSNQALDSTATHDQAASGEDENPSKPEHASHQSEPSGQTKKKKKRDVAARPRSPLNAIVGREASACMGAIPPSEDDSCSLPGKARVALSNGPLKPRATAAKEISKSEPSVAPHSSVGNGSPTSKGQERRVPEDPAPEKTDSPHLHAHFNDIEVQGKTSSGKGGKPLKSSLKEVHAAAPKAVADLPAPVPESAETSSIFTEEEIRERKQAWNRIPMPLDPRKSKKPGSNVSSSQPATPQTPAFNEMENKGYSASFAGEKVHNEPLETLSAKHQESGRSTEGPEASGREKNQRPMNEEYSILEQRPVPKDLSLELPNAKGMNGEDAFDSALKSPASSSWASELVEDTGIGLGTEPPFTGTAAANHQGKPKGKWNKNKKSKKRLTPAPLTASQKDDDSQGRPPSDLDINTIPLEMRLEADHDTLTPTTASSESFPRSMYETERLDKFSSEPLKDARGQGMTSLRGQYHYDTLPRGGLDFRQNAGGSLKVPKKRKNKYPSINSRTFEPSTGGRPMLSPSKQAVGGQMLTTDSKGASTISSTTKAEAPDASRKSRLNPLAIAFESPRKGATAVLGTQASPNNSRATSSRPGTDSLDKPPSPSKAKLVQRPVTAHNSPTKAPQLRERLNRDFAGIEGNTEVSIKQQENNPPVNRREGFNDRRRHQGENKNLLKSSSTSPRREDGQYQANLEAEDWPALPASRMRSATLQ